MAESLEQRVLDYVRERYENNGADWNWVIVREVMDHFSISEREASDVAYALERDGRIKMTPARDGNPVGAVLQFQRPVGAAASITNVIHVAGSVGALQTGMQSQAMIGVTPALDQDDVYDGPYDPVRTPPGDKLHVTEEMRLCMPSLHLEIGRVLATNGRLSFAYRISNIGVGAARRIRLFLPCLGVDDVRRSLQPGERIIRKRPYPGVPYLKPGEDVVTLECEDHAGRQYRQYGRLQQYHVNGDGHPPIYGLLSDELSPPFRVKKASLAREHHEPVQGIDTLDSRLAEYYF